MFSGIVEALGTVAKIESRGPGIRLVIHEPTIAQAVEIGESIANNGCCLTVVESDGENLHFDAGSETLSRTNLGQLAEGSRVNLEQSLRLSDRLGGHFVTGHVDAVGSLDERIDEGDWATLFFRMPKTMGPQMVSKGSIAVDGVSLTLVDVEEERFSVALIPHTLEVTTLGRLNPGDPINLETDMLAKMVEKQLQARGAV